jgi:hypothetical protein
LSATHGTRPLPLTTRCHPVPVQRVVRRGLLLAARLRRGVRVTNGPRGAGQHLHLVQELHPSHCAAGRARQHRQRVPPTLVERCAAVALCCSPVEPVRRLYASSSTLIAAYLARKGGHLCLLCMEMNSVMAVISSDFWTSVMAARAVGSPATPRDCCIQGNTSMSFGCRAYLCILSPPTRAKSAAPAFLRLGARGGWRKTALHCGDGGRAGPWTAARSTHGPSHTSCACWSRSRSPSVHCGRACGVLWLRRRWRGSS